MSKFKRKYERNLSESSSDPDDPGTPPDHFKKPRLESIASSGRRESQASTASSVSASEDEIEKDAANLSKALESTSSSDNEEDFQEPRPSFGQPSNGQAFRGGTSFQVGAGHPSASGSQNRYQAELANRGQSALSEEDSPPNSPVGFGGAPSWSNMSKGHEAGTSSQSSFSTANVIDQRSSLNEPGVYSSAAQKMMQSMGYKSGTGLGKAGQGRVEPVGLSNQRGRRGLGFVIEGLNSDAAIDWNPEEEVVIIEENVNWLPYNSQPPLSIPIRDWLVVGPRKEDISDETLYCDEEVLSNVLACKTVFDQIEPKELMKARSRSNPFETIRSGIFLNRAAMKMANMDAILDFMFTSPKDENGDSLVKSGEPLYFADVCAGPGGFSEYVLWRGNWRAKGFGFTLKTNKHDFRLEDFFAGPPEGFEPYYGVDGVDGDGNVFNTDNILEFKRYVWESTGGKGVHFMMADGGFSVEGNENIQEILSKQLYLCQFIVGLSIVREKGHFVCKLFDLFTPFSVGLLYLLYHAFHQVCIHKPNTSRPANSERYVICKWKKADTEDILRYMLQINSKLNELGFDMGGHTKSGRDVLEIVPADVIKQDQHFYQYIVKSNNDIGSNQVVGLTKIVAFFKNNDLRELRQEEVKAQSLHFWKVPDHTRRKPSIESPKDVCNRLLSELGHRMDLLKKPEVVLNSQAQLKSSFSSVYDWGFVVIGVGQDKAVSERTFLLSTGRSKVFLFNPKTNDWSKLAEDKKINLELPGDTLLYVELVTEYRGEGKSQRKVISVHVIDAIAIAGEKVFKLHFMERYKKAELFVKVMNKHSRKDLAMLRMKTVYNLENLSAVWQKLQTLLLKGGGGSKGLFYAMDSDRPDEQTKYIQPQGLVFYRTVKDPFTMAMSKSQGRKYFFNTKTGTADFNIPPISIAEFDKCHDNRLVWYWDKVPDIFPQGYAHQAADGAVLTRKELEEHVNKTKA